MRVALVTNALEDATRGNHTTVQRWLDHARSVEVTAVPADSEQVLDPVPDLVHGYHARYGGVAALALARRYRVPLAISVGGTDLYELAGGGGTGNGELREVFRAARCVTGAFASFRQTLRDCLGSTVPYVVVPRGMVVSSRSEPRRSDGMLRVLLPAGLRPVKDPLLAMDLAGALVERGVPLRLRILGAVLDRDYAARVHARARNADYVEVGRVSHDRMDEAYREADVVWNTSLHEGGANALLEAVDQGCSLFVRDAPGNREFFTDDGPPGMLFRPGALDRAEEFHRRLLAETQADRRARHARGIAWLRAHHDPQVEAQALCSAWRLAVRRRE